MATEIRVIQGDKLTGNSGKEFRFFIVDTVYWVKEEPVELDLLELSTRRIIRKKYSDIIALIKAGTMEYWLPFGR